MATPEASLASVAPPATEATVAVIETPSENTGNFDVEIWRHAYSCANLKKDKTGYYKITQFQQT